MTNGNGPIARIIKAQRIASDRAVVSIRIYFDGCLFHFAARTGCNGKRLESRGSQLALDIDFRI